MSKLKANAVESLTGTATDFPNSLSIQGKPVGSAATEPTSRFPYVVGSVADLASVPEGLLVDGARFDANEFWPDTGFGGGIFVWRESEDLTPLQGFIIEVAGLPGRFVRAIEGDTVSPRMAGAYMDGLNDDSDAFQAAFDYAETAGLSVSEKGVALIRKTLTSYVPWDFSDLELIIPDDFSKDPTNSRTESVINLFDRDESVYNDVALSASRDDIQSTVLTNLLGDGEFSVLIESEEAAILRNGTSTILKRDILFYTGGTFVPTPFYYSFDSDVKVTAIPLKDNVVIKNPKVSFSGVLPTPLRQVFSVCRNNVTAIGGYCDSLSTSSTSQMFRGFVNFRGTIFNRIEKQKTRTPHVDFCYPCLFTRTYHSVIDDCHDDTGWALIDGNTMRHTVVTNCSGARIGTHESAVDFYVYNFTGNGRAGITVHGRGKLYIENYTDWVTEERGSRSFVSTRSDYGSAWDGEIVIKNPKITFESENSPFCRFIQLNGASNNSVDYGQDCVFPDVYLYDIEIVNNHLASADTAFLLFNLSTDYTQNVVMPKNLVLERLKQKREKRVPLSMNVGHTTETLSVTVSTHPVVTKIKNCVNKTGDSDLFFAMTQAEQDAVKYPIVFEYYECKGVRRAASLPAGDVTKYYDCIVRDIGNSAEPDNSTWEVRGGKIDGNGGAYTFRAGNISLYGVEYTNMTSVSLDLSSARVLHGNVMPSGISAGGTTPAQHWAYVSGEFRTAI